MCHSEIVVYRNVRSQVNDSQKRLKEIENFIDNRVKLFVPLQPSLESMRVIARSLYKSYLFYYPEIKLFQCMYTYTRTEYPDVIRHLRVEDFQYIGRSVYENFMLLADNLVKSGGVPRGGRAMSGTTKNGRLQKRSANQLNLSDFYSTRLRIITEPILNNYIEAHSKQGAAEVITKTPLNDVSLDHSADRKEIPDQVATTKQLDEKVATPSPTPGKFPFVQNPFENDDGFVDPDATIDLTKRETKHKLSSFNLEKFVLRSIGVDPDYIKEWTPVYCGKEYVKDFMRRFAHTFLK